MQKVHPVGRTEITPPSDSRPPKVDRRRRGPIDRDGIAPNRRLTGPRYRTPSERSPTDFAGADTERGRRAGGGDWDRHYDIKGVDPDEPGTSSARRKKPGKRPHDRDRHRRYGGHHRHRHYYGCGHYGYSYSPFAYGYASPYWYWGHGYWGPEIHVYGSGGGGSSRRYRDIGQGALDLDLRPKTTEIYVDGAYVGIADQYDGFPTYLWLDEGTYDLAFYKQGHETVFRRYTIYPGVTIDVDDRLRPGEAVLPVPPVGAAYPAGEATATAPSSAAPPAGVTSSDSGRIAIAATPGDAAVYLDGHFVGTAAEIAELGAGLIVEPGDHVVDIIRPGYDNQRVPVSVAAGERIDVKLDLRRP